MVEELPRFNFGLNILKERKILLLIS